MPPTPLLTLDFRGASVPIIVPPLIPSVVAGAAHGAGHLTIATLGILVLAIGWTGSEAPWLTPTRVALDDATRRRTALENELRGSEAVRNDAALRRKVEGELRQATAYWSGAKLAHDAAVVADIPSDPTERARLAAHVIAGLQGAGIPDAVVGTWAAQAFTACSARFSEGWQQWSDMEAAGFSTPPAEPSSSEGSNSPTAGPATPSAG